MKSDLFLKRLQNFIRYCERVRTRKSKLLLALFFVWTFSLSTNSWAVDPGIDSASNTDLPIGASGRIYFTLCAGGNVCPAGYAGLIVFGSNPQSPTGWINPANGNSSFIPSGAIMAFALNSCPTGWKEANGNNGTLDLRGEFIRGWDDGRGLDPGRMLNSDQGDAIRNIVGSFRIALAATEWASGAFNRSDGGTVIVGHWDGGWSGGTVNFDASTTVPTAFENRPHNIALLYCEKE